MRLIDAPIGIFRFDGELVLKTEYYSENKRSGKYIPDCYIVRSGEYFWGGAKTANELINLDVEPVDFSELLPTLTDTISRQATINLLEELETKRLKGDVDLLYAPMIKGLNALPPAQPEKRTETHACDSISRQQAIDAVSRAEVLRMIDCINDHQAITPYKSVGAVTEHLTRIASNLPPVTPKQRTGKWLWQTGKIKCNQCLRAIRRIDHDGLLNFCPNCGAKMGGDAE